MREMSQEEFLKILDSRPESSLENLNLRPEDLLIPKLFKLVSLEINDISKLNEVSFKDLELKYKIIFVKILLENLAKLDEINFDKVNRYWWEFIVTQVWASSDIYDKNSSNLGFIRFYLDGTPAQRIADNISAHIWQD